MGTRERREREKEQRRKDILSAARKHFWEKGYDATTMPDIARDLELAPGTLYLYFPSKEALYVELLIEGYDLLIRRFEKGIKAGATPRAQVEALIDTFFRFAKDSPEYFDIIFFVVQREGRGIHQLVFEKERSARLAKQEEKCKSFGDSIFRHMSGEPPERIRTRVDALWSMLAGVVFFFVKDPAADFDRISREAKALIMRALFGEGGK